MTFAQFWRDDDDMTHPSNSSFFQNTNETKNTTETKQSRHFISKKPIQPTRNDINTATHQNGNIFETYQEIAASTRKAIAEIESRSLQAKGYYSAPNEVQEQTFCSNHRVTR